ncbi:hypothetical protein AKJ53_01580 [candidate division MSBL1 archaeon SCGC-AAA382F02]|uniref:Small ribosomal subunit protein eS8 n=1 Tax=candidate division MSBL1 archaeon SCGC-AAA382F02 TaxID=1698282 RepID=A0A133VHS9_9EURY|nr:hypothetical protein AKJ53_01580 [candidate division MSBL1 archaeon SCGC-AAA382F02]
MAKWQGKSLKKGSGGRKWLSHKKRKYELGRESADTKIGEKKKTQISVRGTGSKSKLLSINTVNITDPDTGKSTKGEINSVLENPADPHLARRNIITKGAVIDTSMGKARVTSRPGQEGALNAVLIEGNLEEEKETEENSEEKTENSTEKEESA